MQIVKPRLSGACFHIRRYGMTEAHKEKHNAAMASLATAAVLTILKLAVGFYTNSLGILSEALHSGLDLLAAALTLLAVRMAAQPADEHHSYGHGKVENLAALAETALLLVTCGWIIGEAVDRLFYHASPVLPSLWGVAVMGISIALDFHRARLLRRVARKHNSQALEADALHFSSDVLSSSVVLVGLVVIWGAQFLPQENMWRPLLDKADALAALAVSAIVLFACCSLARKAVYELMDGGSAEQRERIRTEAEAMLGAGMVLSVRLRTSGPQSFVDMIVSVPPRLSVEESHRIAYETEQCVQRILPGADVTIQVRPRKQAESDNPLLILQNCAAEHGISVHGLQLLDTQQGLCAELHAELSATLSLGAAHERVTAFESDVRELLPDIEIVSHLEPEGLAARDAVCPLPCADAEKARFEAVVEEQLRHIGNVSGCHKLAAFHMPGGVGDGSVSLSFHCRMAADSTVEQAHAASARLERLLRQVIPHLGRVVIHMEPDSRSGDPSEAVIETA